MALFLKMKSINESEIQESTSPCASHVHIQHLETHNSYFWQTSMREVGGREGEHPNVRNNIPAGVIRLINTFTDGHAHSETGSSKGYQ